MTRDDRVRELSRISKKRLVAQWRSGPGRLVLWTAHPVERWNREELIADILAHEFGGQS